jgi:hypothetical protein
MNIGLCRKHSYPRRGSIMGDGLRRVFTRGVFVRAALLASLVLATPAVAVEDPPVSETVVRETLNLVPGQMGCVTTRIAAVRDDDLTNRVRFSGTASVPLGGPLKPPGWTLFHDNIDGQDGFENRKFLLQWPTSISSLLNTQAYQDNEAFVKDFWFCATNTESSNVTVTLEITSQVRNEVPSPGNVCVPIGLGSWQCQGTLAPGQRACAPSASGYVKSMEAIIGLRPTEVTLTNTRETRSVITDTYASFSLESSNPGFPDAFTGCVRNLDPVEQLNYTFNFF